MGIDMFGCSVSCKCPRCDANREVIKAAEVVLKQWRYQVHTVDAMLNLDKAFMRYWQVNKQAERQANS